MGIGLFVVGLGLIVWGVIYVLNSVQGDRPWPTEFADRKSYNQVKTAMHGSFVGGLTRALFGLIATSLGMRVYRRGAKAEDT